MCEAIKDESVKCELIDFESVREQEEIRKIRIRRFKNAQNRLLKKDLFVIDLVCMILVLSIVGVSIFVWYKYTNTSGETFIKFFITGGILMILLVTTIMDKFKSWFRRKRRNWVRKQIKKSF